MDLNVIFQAIMPVGIWLTFLASCLNIYYTTQNMKLTKYIETITSERIKWLEIIRNDIASLCSELVILFSSAKKGIQLRSEQEEIVSCCPHMFLSLDDDDPIRIKYYEKDKEFEDIKQKIHDDEKRISIIRRIYLVILRLNHIEDDHIIIKLDAIKSVIQKDVFEKEEIENCLSLLDDIIKKSQFMLKDEWEKVKEETYKGSKIKNRAKVR